jgi:hypothetical protein
MRIQNEPNAISEIALDVVSELEALVPWRIVPLYDIHVAAACDEPAYPRALWIQVKDVGMVDERVADQYGTRT